MQWQFHDTTANRATDYSRESSSQILLGGIKKSISKRRVPIEVRKSIAYASSSSTPVFPQIKKSFSGAKINKPKEVIPAYRKTRNILERDPPMLQTLLREASDQRIRNKLRKPRRLQSSQQLFQAPPRLKPLTYLSTRSLHRKSPHFEEDNKLVLSKSTRNVLAKRKKVQEEKKSSSPYKFRFTPFKHEVKQPRTEENEQQTPPKQRVAREIPFEVLEDAQLTFNQGNQKEEQEMNERVLKERVEGRIKDFSRKYRFQNAPAALRVQGILSAVSQHPLVQDSSANREKKRKDVEMMEKRMKKAIKNEKQATDKIVQRIMKMCMETLKQQDEPSFKTINVSERFKAEVNYLERIKHKAKEQPQSKTSVSTIRSSRSVARGV